jgi:hypothetical protein
MELGDGAPTSAIRVAQPALSRQVQDLEDEIGVDALRRAPRGVTQREKKAFSGGSARVAEARR